MIVPPDKLDSLKDILSDAHLRERIAPRCGDGHYLHLADLLLALQEHATDARVHILDYGAGISPYRSLFPHARYARADFAIGDGAGLEFILDETLRIAAPPETFDMVLSTQVLEHVAEPQNYLAECFRLLRPGGKLVLTTHGIYADHPCPLDLHRWTAEGLAAACEKAGFEIRSSAKLTADARALLFLYDVHGTSLRGRKTSLVSILSAVYGKIHRRFRRQIHEWADRSFAASRNVKSPVDGKIYINLLVHAVKPGRQ